jgi:TRAP-type C4-dicarboxylate transport system permease small subunit
MKLEKKISDTISKVEEFILSYTVIIMAVILVGNVVSRTILNRSWTFAEEVGQSLIIIMTFSGIGYGAKKARHISMSAIFDLVPMKIKKIFILVISFVSSLVMFFLTYMGVEYVQRVYALGRVTPALRIPIFIIYAIVPIGFFLGGVQYALNFVKNIREKEVFLSTERGLRD